MACVSIHLQTFPSFVPYRSPGGYRIVRHCVRVHRSFFLIVLEKNQSVRISRLYEIAPEPDLQSPFRTRKGQTQSQQIRSAVFHRSESCQLKGPNERITSSQADLSRA